MRKYLYLAVFVSGLTSLAVEMAASRLLGNVFGTSNLVWASIIGLILIYLSAGYFLGGFWADRSPHFKTFYQILMWAAIGTALAPVISRPILRLAANAFDQLQLGVLFGSFTTVLILLAVPITLLGTASPFAIRLAVQDSRGIGSISGRIYAISTLGSFIGTFLPVLLLIPTIGTYRTFLVISAVLMVTALIGLLLTSGWKLALVYSWMPVVVLVLYVIGLPGTDKSTRGMVYETESAYNYIQVLQQDGYTMLRLNEGQGIHSIYSPDQLFYHGSWDMVLAAPFYNPAPYQPSSVKRMAIVGLAAGTTARQATTVFGGIPIDGYEIDPKIVEVGRKYFDMNMPNLNVIVQDGRWGLEHSPYRYQVISVDAYRPPYIPYQMTTRQFFQIVYDKLTMDGVMAINVGRSPTDRSLIDTLASTIGAVFPSVYVVDIPGTLNTMIYASRQPSSPANLAVNYQRLATQPGTPQLLLDALQIAVTGLQPASPPAQVFTDDVAPVEWITNSMVLSFLFDNEMEVVR